MSTVSHVSYPLYAFRDFQVETQMHQTSRLSKIGLFQLSTQSTISTRVDILLYFYKSASTELLWEFLLRSAQGRWVTVDCFEELAHQCLLDTCDTIMIQHFEDDFMDMCRNVHIIFENCWWKIQMIQVLRSSASSSCSWRKVRQHPIPLISWPRRRPSGAPVVPVKFFPVTPLRRIKMPSQVKIIKKWMSQGWGSGKQMLEPGKQD